MDWTDDGIVLSARKHGETSVIACLITRRHGVHSGLVRGGAGKRARGIFQPGNLVAARWRGRLSEHLGSYTCELTEAVAAPLLKDPLRLAGLSAACALTQAAMAERDPHEDVFDGLMAVLDALEGEFWPAIYARWEVGLLGALGFGLDLSQCAATGSTDELVYVSPKTGRAVSMSAGEPYKDILLPLPPFLLNGGAGEDKAAVADSLKLTGYFLERHVFAPHHRPLPAARQRLLERLASQPI